jgi:hypothetical protein
VPVPLLSKEEMKTNMTRAKVSTVQKYDAPLNMAKSSNIVGQPLIKKPSSLNQTYTGAMSSPSYSDKTSLPNTKMAPFDHTPYVLSSGYKVDDASE